MRKLKVSVALMIILVFGLLGTALAFYYPPTHVPPGPPPNYTEIDTSHFLGVPYLPMPPPDSGGFYIWYDQGMWQIANHIYSPGLSHEQFHAAILVMLDQPPTLNVNVFIEELEFWGDTTKSLCLKENDRWGWKPWGENLYEIWWDMTTRHGQEEDIDPNDLLKLSIVGCVADLNLWSSGMGSPFGPHEVFLGGDKKPLSTVPEYSDYFPGISDPYQSQAGSDPSNSSNITIFTKYSDTLRTYNSSGLIDSTDSYTCGLSVDYGQRYAGTFAYEGNGIQFSTNAVYQVNDPPELQVPDDTTYYLCTEDLVSFQVCATDPDENDTLVLEKVSGPGTFPADTGTSPLCENLLWYPSSETTAEFIFKAIDKYGETDEETVMVTVDFSDPPVVVAPDTVLVQQEKTAEYNFTASDPDDEKLEDDAGITVDPDCGIYSAQRLSGSGTSSGEWKVSFEATNCAVGYYTVEVEIEDSCGKAGVDTTIVGVQPRENNAPIVTVPENRSGIMGDTITYNAEAYDPDGDLLLDNENVTVIPDCGGVAGIRISGGGTSSGVWEITFYTLGCDSGNYKVAVEIEDALGATGSDTTYMSIGKKGPTDISERSSDKITGFSLKQSYPNPFNPVCNIEYALPTDCHVTLTVYNILGQKVKILVNEYQGSGHKSVQWDGKDDQGQDVSSGLYFYRIQAGDFFQLKRMVLLK